jgi:hypothetical protein
MLHRVAFATSLTILSAGLYLLFYIFAVIAPQAFRFVFNAQFLVLTWRRYSPGSSPMGASWEL